MNAPTASDREAEAPAPESASRSELIVPILVIAYAVAYLMHVHNLPLAATLYPYLLIGAIAVGLGVVIVSQRRHLRFALPARRQQQGVAAAASQRGQAALPAIFLAASALYPVFVTRLGFAVTTAAYVLLMLRAFGEKRWLRAVLISVATMLGFLIGVDWLVGIPLPRFSFATLPLGI